MELGAPMIAAWMNKLPFVRWDRFVRAPVGDDTSDEILAVYGWIDRDDGRSDFVLLEFATWADAPSSVTSSAEHSKLINHLLYGAGGPHHDCQRVEEHFGAFVTNKVCL